MDECCGVAEVAWKGGEGVADRLQPEKLLVASLVENREGAHAGCVLSVEEVYARRRAPESSVASSTTHRRGTFLDLMQTCLPWL